MDDNMNIAVKQLAKISEQLDSLNKNVIKLIDVEKQILKESKSHSGKVQLIAESSNAKQKIDVHKFVENILRMPLGETVKLENKRAEEDILRGNV